MERERVSNGQFAPKRPRGRAFPKGHPKLPNSGRKPGTPNRVTRAVKEFLAALVDDSEVQDAVRERIVRGDAVAFFRALEHVAGKPVEKRETELNGNLRVSWGDGG